MENTSKQPQFSNPAVQSRFNRLPLSLQEGIMQSGLDFSSVEELDAFAENSLIEEKASSASAEG